MTGSILSRSTLSSQSLLSSTQSQVDGLVGGFTAQATDWRSLAAMMAGGVAYRVGRVGIMGLGSGQALRTASVGIGLSAEVAAFEGAHRGLSALSGESHLNPNLFRWNGNGGLRQGLLHSFVTFGTLKAGGRLAQGQNVIAQHLLQDSAMVLGHQVTGALSLAPRPTGSLAEQFLHAEATNLQLGAGMALAGRLAPGVHAMERGLDLSLRGTGVGANLVFARNGDRDGQKQGAPLQEALQPAFAGNSESAPVSPPAREKVWTRPSLSQMSSIEHEGGREGIAGGSLDSKSEHPVSEPPPVTEPASPRALDEARQTVTDSSSPLVLDPRIITLGETLDLINHLWTVSEADARPAFIELDRRSNKLNSEENHILSRVLEVGLSHAETRRRVVALTGLSTIATRVEPARRWSEVEKIFPFLSDSEFEVRAVAKNALLHLGLFLNSFELSRLDRDLVNIALLETHPARIEALSILTSHFSHLPNQSRVPLARAIVEGFAIQDGLSRPEAILRLTLQHLSREQQAEFMEWVEGRFPERREDLLGIYRNLREELSKDGELLTTLPSPAYHETSSAPSSSGTPSSSWLVEPVLRSIRRHMPENEQRNFIRWLTDRFPERREEITQAYEPSNASPAKTEGGIDPLSWEVESPGYQGKAAAFLRGIRVTPWQRLVGSVGEGEVLTTRGSLRSTWSAAIKGIDHPQTLAYLGEDVGVVRYAGRNERGEETWVRNDDSNAPITAREIAENFGEKLLRESGVREMPLEGDARKLPVRFGGLIPEGLRGKERLFSRMGITPEAVKGTAFENQYGKLSNFANAGDLTAYGLYSAIRASLAFGRGLHHYFESSRFGAAQGTAFPDLGIWALIYERAKAGKESNPLDLQSALPETVRGNFLNLMLPHGPPVDFNKPLQEIIEALRPIIPGDGRMPRTGGVNLTFSQACASGLYALWGAREAMIPNGVAGEYPMDAMMVISADATFSPYGVAPAAAGFGRKAPMTVTDMVKKLETQGLVGPRNQVSDARGGERTEYAEEVWERLPEDLRRRAMNEASAPFTRFSQGLVVGEGSSALPWVNFQTQLARGLWPSSLLLGLHVAAGEGGTSNLASMDQGIVTATRVALQMAQAHGARPKVVNAHGTNTKLNNIAEYLSLYFALRDSGFHHEMAVAAIKGLVEHTMGAASGIDSVLSVQALNRGIAPGLTNFRTEDLDPRFEGQAAEILRQLKFSSEPIRGDIDSILILSEGFLSANAAGVIGRFPQDASEAKAVLRDYGVPQHIRDDWAVRAQENRAQGREMEENLRRGRISHLDAFDQLRFRP